MQQFKEVMIRVEEMMNGGGDDGGEHHAGGMDADTAKLFGEIA